MKCSVPEIAWHNREPVLSVAFQPNAKAPVSGPLRLASGGADSHLLIWYVKCEQDSSVSLEIVTDLARHQKAVNVVRWSPNGEILASGDDESIIILWKQKTEVDPPPLLEQPSDEDREIWLQYKVLRGHLEDIYDISWCPFGNYLASGSVDNTAFIWDIHKGKNLGVLTDHKGFVQGISWDPKNQYIATMCSDSVFRLFDINTKKVVGRSSKTALPVPTTHHLHGQSYKLFYDGSLQSYFRRLDYSPNGELIAVPTGFIEYDENGTVNHLNAAFIYKRSQIKSPICMLPCGESPSLVVRWSPVSYKLKEDGPTPRIRFPSPIRLLLAVATRTSILIYDTQQSTPLAVLTNMHYTRLSDLTWSSDGLLLVASSTDGFCSIVRFVHGELGEAVEGNSLPTPEMNEVEMREVTETHNKENIVKDVNVNRVCDITPNKKAERKQNSATLTPKSKTPLGKKKIGTPSTGKSDSDAEKNAALLDEAAMEPWSQDGSDLQTSKDENSAKTSPPEIVIDDPTEDIKMVYEESVTNVQEEANKVESVKVFPCVPEVVEVPKVAPKTPRRVSFITLSSPKNKKNL